MTLIAFHRGTCALASTAGGRKRAIAGAALMCFALALPATAVASDPDPGAVTEQTSEAVAAVGGAPAAENAAAEIPASGSGLASLGLGDAGSISIDLPAKGAGRSEDGVRPSTTRSPPRLRSRSSRRARDCAR